MYVPVVSRTGKPVMPCHPARTRELVRQGKAVRRFDRGIFYIRLTERTDGDLQPIAAGCDPGSKKEGFTVKSEKQTFLNIQADAVTWVSDAVATRRQMRRTRRYRKAPCRQNRQNRARGGIPPSTKARWQWKLRICRWLARLFPIECFIVEDIKAKTTGKRRWDKSFSPLEVGKQWFYSELLTLAKVKTKPGFETSRLRQAQGLKKTSKKTAEVFEAHCVDSWILANGYTGGHIHPDNTRLLCITPLRFHRRQLHRLQPDKGGIRKSYGGTRSHGFKRGSLVKHVRLGLAYVGGYLKDRISLHSLSDGKRLTQSAKPADCTFLAFNSWRPRFLPAVNDGVSARKN
ncbi:MAG: RRXRR domain-containing protein [Candidatus Competibacteraceae bacterium]